MKLCFPVPPIKIKTNIFPNRYQKQPAHVPVPHQKLIDDHIPIFFGLVLPPVVNENGSRFVALIACRLLHFAGALFEVSGTRIF